MRLSLLIMASFFCFFMAPLCGMKESTRRVQFAPDECTLVLFPPELPHEESMELNAQLVDAVLEKYNEYQALRYDDDLCVLIESVFSCLIGQVTTESWLKAIIDCLTTHGVERAETQCARWSPGIGFSQLSSSNNIFHYLAQSHGRLLNCPTDKASQLISYVCDHCEDFGISHEQLQILLAAGYYESPSSNSGNTPLHLAINEEADDIARALVAHGAPVNEPNARGDTPLHCAAKKGIEMVTIVLAGQPNVYAKNNTGCTPLHTAVLAGDLDVVFELCQFARVDVRDGYEMTPLHLAAQGGDDEIAEILLDAGASIEAMDGEGNTPLHWATQNQHAEVVRLLVQRGASMTVQNEAGHSPVNTLLNLLKPEWISMLRALVQYGTPENLVSAPAEASSLTPMTTYLYVMVALMATHGAVSC